MFSLNKLHNSGFININLVPVQAKIRTLIKDLFKATTQKNLHYKRRDLKE